MIDDRTITAFGANLIPQAFERRHTAYRVDRVDPVPTGPADYEDWVATLRTELLVDRYPAGHRPVRIIVVEGADGVRWRWDGNPCCEPSWLVDRVRHEARPIPQPWVFAMELPWPEPAWERYDPLEGDWVELVEPAWTQLEWRATWYAEARGRGVADTRAGVIDLRYDPEADADTVLAVHAQAPRRGLPGVFHRVLFRHPSRQAYPLRSS